MNRDALWLAAGFFGQGLFALRFLLQWWRSERAGESIVPVEFWYLSIGGSLVLLLYAIHRRDPVFFLGQLTGFVVYFRNLHLIHRPRARSGRVAP
jgi:lipid-A-disaccharide synthase-like uncharacterized protein